MVQYNRCMQLAQLGQLAITFALLASISEALEPGLPSKTAVLIATARAVGSRDPNPEFRNPDYLAIKFLGPRERSILSPELDMSALDLDFDTAMKRLGMHVGASTQMWRTKAFDAAILDALRNGARQVVVLGAGFDSRGYRFQSQLRGVRFMEVDSTPTQEYKKQRVREIFGGLPGNVTYVPMDFTKDDLLTQLVKAGYSEKEKTFFLWEGVTEYLPESAVKETLHFVRDHAAPGSRIAFDYTLSSDPTVNNPNSRFARWGEPWLFGFPGRDAAPYVEQEGLEVVSEGARGYSNFCIAGVAQRN